MSPYLFSICSAVYTTLSALIAIQARQRTNLLLAACCGITGVWAGCGVYWPQPALDGVAGLIDLLRLLIWYVYLLYLYKRSGVSSAWQIRGFSLIAAVGIVAGLAVALTGDVSLSYALSSLPISSRLLICVSELLLIENLYLNLPATSRWHIALPCVLLGALACFDILVIADTALFRRPSIPLASARAVAMIIVAPLLVLAALRGQRWNEPVRLSRTAIFHSATLVLSGSVLLALALTGEALRHFNETWGWVAELSLVFSGLISILLFLSSRSARSFLDRVVIHHFFADRYDYRIQWLNCIATLSGKGSHELSDLYTRAIRSVADVVDSPSGALFICDQTTGSMTWANSWNMPASTQLSASHPLVQIMVNDEKICDCSEMQLEDLDSDSLSQLGPTWLAVPLTHSRGVAGFVIVGPPRVNFHLDVEVFDLLGILGQEVATYIIEQQAAQAVNQARHLHDYGKRFAFVAHDIKNVSSQLALLLRNAEVHLDNPAFQRDMIETVRSSVQKIDRLLKRLDQPSADIARAAVAPITRLEGLLASYNRARQVSVKLKHDELSASIEISPEAFDDIITHLLNNAVEAAPSQEVVIEVAHGADQVVIEITDRGGGMSPEFVRDELFSPFKTKRNGGSGIGAFQARELIKEAGGELLVISHKGLGTTMRISFKRSGNPGSAPFRPILIGAHGD